MTFTITGGNDFHQHHNHQPHPHATARLTTTAAQLYTEAGQRGTSAAQHTTATGQLQAASFHGTAIAQRYAAGPIASSAQPALTEE